MDLGIEAAVRQILTAITDIPVVETDVIQDYPMTAQGGPASYITFIVVAAPTAAFGLAAGSTVLRRGFVQVDLNVPETAGKPAARQAGDRVVRLFPRLTQLGLARIERPSYATEPMQDTPYNHVPVTIPWVARVKEKD